MRQIALGVQGQAVVGRIGAALSELAAVRRGPG